MPEYILPLSCCDGIQEPRFEQQVLSQGGLGQQRGPSPSPFCSALMLSLPAFCCSQGEALGLESQKGPEPGLLLQPLLSPSSAPAVLGCRRKELCWGSARAP